MPNTTPGADKACLQMICDLIRGAVRSVVVLEDDRIVDQMLVALAAGGHILLNDIPGVGKTLLARTFARVLGLDFKRIQFTPDLLPSDVTGLNYYNQKAGDFEFRPGPVFTHVLLADEINRATPRTQAALLECMQESRVTVDGISRPLAQPFIVVATQNPVEMEGTFPLPEAQVDRFLLCLKLGYPGAQAEREIALRFLADNPEVPLRPVGPTEIQALVAATEHTHFAAPVLDYAIEVCRATREMKNIRLGVSPRGSLALAKASRALAAIKGRGYVLPDDVQEMAEPVLAHRIVSDLDSQLYYTTSSDIVRQALGKVPVPTGSFTS